MQLIKAVSEYFVLFNQESFLNNHFKTKEKNQTPEQLNAHYFLLSRNIFKFWQQAAVILTIPITLLEHAELVTKKQTLCEGLAK